MGTCCPLVTNTREPFKAALLTRSEVSNKSRLNSIHSHYKFIKVLGFGQFGTVREATKLDSQSKSFAIKSISKEKVFKKFSVLKSELDLLSIVDHPNIIKLHEIYEDEKYLHLVLDLCRGGDLYDYILNKGSLTEKEVMIVMKKVFLAVNHLHTVSICHRDLKPDNFLLVSHEANSEVKLVDFGMAVKFSEDPMHTVVGTPYYLAPEVCLGNYGKECDVWSLGVVMFFLLTGRQPFKGKNMSELLSNILNCRYSFNDPKWNLVSEEAKDLISRLLVVDPLLRLSIPSALCHSWFSNLTGLPPVKLEIFNSLKNFKAHGKLWNEVMKVFIKNLSYEEIQTLDSAFKAIDLEHTGFITAENIERAMLSNGYPVVAEEIRKLIDLIDYLGKGKLNYTQFLIVTADRRSIFDEESIWSAFNYFDIVFFI
jgi:calcium-dependent protein kinase